MKNGSAQEGELKAREDRVIRKWPLKRRWNRTSLEGGIKRNKPTGWQGMIRGTEMAEWKGNERGQLSFVPSWQTVKRLTLETISLCVFLRLTDFNNLPGQSCRYSTAPMPGLCPSRRCVTLHSSAFTAFSSSHDSHHCHSPGMSLIPFYFFSFTALTSCLTLPRLFFVLGPFDILCEEEVSNL